MYTYQWRKASKEFLKKHPLCVHCEREGRLIPATEVDHIKPHGGDRKLFWNKNNWQPKPARRTYIKKANGKMRPLGIPTFTDKLVQEVLRMVMEVVYEPVFLNCSHGFRPKRSCHTALSTLKKEFTGAKWFVEGDIKGCFDNIDHAVLVGFINQKIKDARLIKLIYRFLKAGFVENWQYNNTYSGTPQGGIISPLLANIYLHELDKFVMTLKSEFDKPNETVRTKEYNRLFTQRVKLKKLIDCADGEEKQDLLKMADISWGTMARLNTNEYVSLEVIDKLCNVLDCQPGDLIEFLKK